MIDIEESEEFWQAREWRNNKKNRYKGFEDLDGFEYDVWADEMEPTIYKSYKHNRAENFSGNWSEIVTQIILRKSWLDEHLKITAC